MGFQIDDVSFQISTFLLLFLIVLIIVAVMYIIDKKKPAKEEKEVGPESVNIRELEDWGAKKKVIPIVRVSGPILSNPQGVPFFLRSKVTFGDHFSWMMDVLAEDDAIPAVIVEFCTPGGSVSGSSLIADAIRACSKKKPVYASISDVSASGGVWGMVAADKIISQPGALIGSIGVVGPALLTYEGVTEMSGSFGGNRIVAEKIHGRVLSAGRGKALGHPFATPEEGAIEDFQKLLDETYEQFINHVAKARGISEQAICDLGAALLHPEDAQKLGLIDGIMPLHEFKRWVARELRVNPEECSFPILEEKKKMLQRIGVMGMELLRTESAMSDDPIRQVLAQHPRLLVSPNCYRLL